MKIGLDTFTIRELDLDFIGQLDFVRDHGLAGAQLHDIPSDPGEMREIRAHADELGLFTRIAVSPCNPLYAGMDEAELLGKLTTDIRNAAECGWHELRSIMGDHLTRYEHNSPWADHMEATIRLLSKLRPALRDHGCRINIENHGDATTHDLVRIVGEVGADTTGICLDPGNLLVLGEDPVAATRRAAPYVHLTHAKDAILYFGPDCIRRQVRPPGGGIVDWPAVLGILAAANPDLPVAIEDHKWLFDVRVFDAEWHAEQPDLTAAELGRFVGYAASCQQRILAGCLEDPESYEAIPYLDQIGERLAAGRDFLHLAVGQAMGSVA